jgi:hypothetical protein
MEVLHLGGIYRQDHVIINYTNFKSELNSAFLIPCLKDSSVFVYGL